MTDQIIKQLALRYRQAIEIAKKNRQFVKDFSFNRFPKGCCGDTSYLLADYLQRQSLKTVWYSAERGGWSHAWLVVKDSRIEPPTPSRFSWPEEMWDVLSSYGVENPKQEKVEIQYEKNNLKNGLLIDITGDQFEDYDIPVYVGPMDEFHRSFSFIQAHDYNGLGNYRLSKLLLLIEQYLVD